MSVIKRQIDEKRDGKRRRAKKRKAEVSWGDVDDRTIRDILAFAESVDGAVRFGRSRDRAVYSLGFYIAGEHFTEWIRNDSGTCTEFADLLDELAEDYELPNEFSESPES